MVTEDEVEIHTSDGLVLRGRWHRSVSPETTVVIAHGFSAGRNEPAVAALAQDLLEARCDVLTYDARGHGASEGRSGVGSTEHRDVASAASLAAGEGRPVVLIGVSMGAVAVVSHLATAGVDAGPVVGAVLVSGPARWGMRPSPIGVLMAALTKGPVGRWVAERYLKVRIARRWRTGEDPAAAMRRVDVPVAVVHGTSDRLLAVAHGHLLHEAAAGPSRLQLVEGMAHGIDRACRAATFDAVEWVLEEAASRTLSPALV